MSSIIKVQFYGITQQWQSNSSINEETLVMCTVLMSPEVTVPACKLKTNYLICACIDWRIPEFTPTKLRVRNGKNLQ